MYDNTFYKEIKDISKLIIANFKKLSNNAFSTVLCRNKKIVKRICFRLNYLVGITDIRNDIQLQPITQSLNVKIILNLNFL